MKDTTKGLPGPSAPDPAAQGLLVFDGAAGAGDHATQRVHSLCNSVDGGEACEVREAAEHVSRNGRDSLMDCERAAGSGAEGPGRPAREGGAAGRSWANSDELHRYLQDRGASLDPAEMTRLVAEYYRVVEDEAAAARKHANVVPLRQPRWKVFRSEFQKRRAELTAEFKAGKVDEERARNSLALMVSKAFGSCGNAQVRAVARVMERTSTSAVRDAVVSILQEQRAGNSTVKNPFGVLEHRARCNMPSSETAARGVR